MVQGIKEKVGKGSQFYFAKLLVAISCKFKCPETGTAMAVAAVAAATALV